MSTFLATDSARVLEGVMSHRAVFSGLGLDIRGVFDRYAAEFQPGTGMAVAGQNSTLSVAFSRVKAVFDAIKGEIVRIYDPESTGNEAEYADFVAGEPMKYENLTVEIPLQASE